MRIIGKVPCPEFRKRVSDVTYDILKIEDKEAYGVFMQKVNVREGSGFGSLACIGMTRDGTVVMTYDWDIIKKLSNLGLQLTQEHEILHFVLGHVSRRGDELKEMYGEVALIAADIVVNQLMDWETLQKELGFRLATYQYYDLPANLTTAEYCELLYEKFKKNTLDKKEKKDEEEQGCSGKGLNGGKKAQNDEDLQGKGSSPSPGNGDPRDGKPLETYDFEDAPEALKNAKAGQLVKELAEHARIRGTKMRGFEHADYKEYIEALNKRPEIRWEHMLRRFEGRYLKVKRVINKKRPSRRHPDFFGRKRKKGLHVAFVVDTSGSMGSEDLQMVYPEIKGIAERGSKVTIIHVDSKVGKIEEYRPGMKIDQFFGRGGTDFDPGFEAATELPLPPDFLVYFTDGGASVSNEWENCFPTLWVLTQDGHNIKDFRNQVCAWGDVVRLKPGGGYEGE